MFKSIFGAAMVAGSVGLGGMGLNEASTAFGCPGLADQAWSDGGFGDQAPAILKMTADDFELRGDRQKGLRLLANGIQRLTGHAVDCGSLTAPVRSARAGAAAIGSAAARDLPAYSYTPSGAAPEPVAYEPPAPPPVRIQYRPVRSLWR